MLNEKPIKTFHLEGGWMKKHKQFAKSEKINENVEMKKTMRNILENSSLGD
jgi:hypothetical protein